MNVEVLQELINKRALARLRKDLVEISTFIRGNRILSESSIPQLTFKMVPDSKGEQKTDTKAPYWVFQFEKSQYGTDNYSGSAYMQTLLDHWLPIYVAEESRLFMEQVEKLQGDVNDLLTAKEYGE